jgi:hypothetical protein
LGWWWGLAVWLSWWSNRIKPRKGFWPQWPSFVFLLIMRRVCVSTRTSGSLWHLRPRAHMALHFCKLVIPWWWMCRHLAWPAVHIPASSIVLGSLCSKTHRWQKNAPAVQEQDQISTPSLEGENLQMFFLLWHSPQHGTPGCHVENGPCYLMFESRLWNNVSSVISLSLWTLLNAKYFG